MPAQEMRSSTNATQSICDAVYILALNENRTKEVAILYINPKLNAFLSERIVARLELQRLI